VLPPATGCSPAEPDVPTIPLITKDNKRYQQNCSPQDSSVIILITEQITLLNMAPNPFFSGRIPKDLHERIAKYTEETGESKTQLLINALATYLNYPVQSTNSASASVDQRLTELEQRVLILDELSGEVAKLRSLLLERVSSFDNKPDNISDNRMISKGQLSLLENDNKSDSNLDNALVSGVEPETREDVDEILDKTPQTQEGFFGRFRSAEISKLPGLEHEDRKKINIKLSNAPKTKDQTAVIKPYRCVFFGYTDKPGKNGKHEKLWNVYTS
jgi:hypothetical protein